MKPDEARRVVENRLRVWGVLKLQQPTAPISNAYNIVPVRSSETCSQEERHVTKWDAEIVISAQVAEAMKNLSDSQRKLLEMRYVQHMPWEEIAEALHVSRREALYEKSAILSCLAYAFGLFTNSQSLHTVRHSSDV